jgi:hypothetical protein
MTINRSGMPAVESQRKAPTLKHASITAAAENLPSTRGIARNIRISATTPTAQIKPIAVAE